MRSLPRTLALAASALALLVPAACQSETTPTSDTAPAADRTVTITSPQNGAAVGSSVPIKFTTSVPIGPLETGKDHVHVIVDGDTNNFVVVTAHQTTVKNLSPGKHTIGVTLQHADHSPAGAQDQITVNVRGKAQASGPKVTITSPQNGAAVGSSVPIKFTTSVPIGPLDTGKDHVHVFVDGNTNDFAVITAHQTTVKNLSPGKHTIGVTLQHADHSPAGAQDQVTVTVRGTGTGGNTGGGM